MSPYQRTDDFIDLWTANSRRVYTFIVSLVPHWSDADEILQETSRTLWEKFDQYEEGSNFTSWACRVAYLKVLEYRKRARRVPLPFSDAFVGTVEGELSAHVEDLSPRYALLLQCLERLDQRQRELIRRRYEQGETISSTAAAMSRTTAWVYKTLSRVHAALLECVERSMRQEARP
jgi:RNA polymerase sigma-70 factor, ECF subfamily